MWRKIRARLLKRDDDGLRAELEHHLAELREDGDPAKLGNLTAIEETVYEMSPFHWIDSGTRDLRLAGRTLRRHAATYITAAGILALGIGMSVAMFSLVDAVLLRPLPFTGQDLVEVIWKEDPLAGAHIEEMAYPELRDLQENVPALEYAAVMPASLYGYARVLQTGSAEPVVIESALVSQDFFRVLGVEPVLGRNFSRDDEGVGAAPVVILSDGVWRNHLGANPAIVGQLVRLSGRGHTVIGVMAPGVEFPRGVGLWVPLGVEQRIIERRGATFLLAIARRKPGHPRQYAVDQIQGLFRRLALDHPEVYSKTQRGVVAPLVEYWTGTARIHLWIMMGASVLLLLTAIMNAGNLLLSRSLSRRAEFATRLALGAPGHRIVAQLAAEGALTALMSIAAGLGIARIAIRSLLAWAPVDIPRLGEAALDFNSVLFAAAAVILASIVCTVMPALSVTGRKVDEVLREGGARLSASRRGRRMRSLVLASQASVTVVLLAMAVLLALSYRSLAPENAGFAHRDALTLNLTLRGPGVFGGQSFDPRSRRAFYRDLLERLRAAPGVASAAAILLRPLEGPIGWDVPYEFEFDGAGGRRAGGAAALPKVNFEVVTPGYFATVGTPLLEGRDFNEHDSGESEPVVIVSRGLAERVRAAGREPLGQRLKLGFRGASWSTIVGVAAEARYRNIGRPGDDIFVPHLQSEVATNYVVIRGGGGQSAEALAALVRGTLSEIDAGQAIAGVATIGQLIDASTARHRFNMVLLSWFGICAAVLAAMGVYSAVAETIEARRREIAIRNVLGAQRRDLVREIAAGTLCFVVAGELLGALAIPGLGAAASPLLHGVSPRDPIVLISVTSLLFLIATGAAIWPAWQAAGADPKAALTRGQ